MKTVAEMSQAELAAFVQTHLRQKGITVVLSGGAVVAIYTDGQYVSLDIDLIDLYPTDRREIHTAMGELSFVQSGRHYRHNHSPYFIDVIPGPLAVGGEPVTTTDELYFETGQLTLLSPTDCVKDRLSAYYHWGDRQCLSQATSISKNKNVDMDDIERWSEKEGKSDEYMRIRSQLK